MFTSIGRVCIVLAGATVVAPLAASSGAGVAAAIDNPTAPGLVYCFGITADGPGVIHALPSVAITWGTAGDDVIIGSAGNDRIFGLGGNDRICGGDGADYVEGGLLAGGSGANDVDHIDGGTGSDVLHGGQMTDYIYGGTNFSPAGAYQTHDFLYGDDGDDLLFGESGPDGLNGGYGVDVCDGGTGMVGDRPEDDVADGATCEVRLGVESTL